MPINRMNHTIMSVAAAGLMASWLLTGCSSEPDGDARQALGLAEGSSEGSSDVEASEAPIEATDDGEAVDADAAEPPLETSQLRIPQVVVRTIGNCLIIRIGNVTRIDCPGASMQEADLRGINLNGANLRGADLSGANLRGNSVAGADLSGANLSGAIWTDGGICGSGSIGRCR